MEKKIISMYSRDKITSLYNLNLAVNELVQEGWQAEGETIIVRFKGAYAFWQVYQTVVRKTN